LFQIATKKEFILHTNTKTQNSILEKIVIYFVCMVKLAYITPCLITQKNKDQSFYSLHNIMSETKPNPWFCITDDKAGAKDVISSTRYYYQIFCAQTSELVRYIYN